MRALVVWQPWAEMIAAGIKWAEYRTWPHNLPPALVAIHGGSRTPNAPYLMEIITQLRDDLIPCRWRGNHSDAINLVAQRGPKGWVRRRVVAVVRFGPAKQLEEKRFAWPILEVTRADSPPIRGRQRFFTIPDELISYSGRTIHH